MSILELSQVSYYYSKNHIVLNNLTEQFETGKVYTVFGPSGCGKTTLLSLLGGLDTPRSGSILFDGQDIQHAGLAEHRRKNISFVFQNYNLIDYMTPEENVRLITRNDVLPILEKVGLSKEETKRNILKLSGGQQQRVAIARALASENPVILADEPTGNLDEDTSQEIIDIFREAANVFQKCVIIVSHSNEVIKAADIVFRLKRGKLEKINFEEE